MTKLTIILRYSKCYLHIYTSIASTNGGMVGEYVCAACRLAWIIHAPMVEVGVECYRIVTSYLQ